MQGKNALVPIHVDIQQGSLRSMAMPRDARKRVAGFPMRFSADARCRPDCHDQAIKIALNIHKAFKPLR
ncbi:hypothetical protein GCM10007901_02650 [Dyella acidisoli]|uniref:Uncharacterized protein n=1 Tax=Dyella acidisoli TaxID=1867834 RepID=A0ABQ5XI06_9GAMM|nr:hypothetical protein GCM10007901_02650 [Dyella acidisoli]